MRGSSVLATSYDVALLDLDGVVYLGEEAVPAAPDALAKCRQAGMRLAFVTNNASRTPTAVTELLTRVGVPAEVAEVTTSAQAAAHYLAQHLQAAARVLVLGTQALVDAVLERGLTPVTSAEDDPAAVVQGYSPEMNWRMLAEGTVAVRRGAMFVATNLDPTVPSLRGPLPGNGSLVAVLSSSTGVAPVATGKPDPTMHAESVQRSGAQNPLVVGDRLDTDIEGARRVGCASLLVFSGVTDAATLLAAPPHQRPDYLGQDVSALLIEHPDVVIDGDYYRCGAARVQRRQAGLRLAGAGGIDGLDGLRALVVAAWAAADAGDPSLPVSAADDAARDLLATLGLA
jgi:glycerol 3-phosphatase-2